MLTMKEIIRTFYNALSQNFSKKLKNHRGNWNQNDPTADDYIKNRPFYTDESVRNTIVPKQQVDMTSSPFAEFSLTELIEFVTGQTYEIVWDNKTYLCVAFDLDGVGAIGNQGILGNGIDTGEPFMIAISKAEDLGIAIGKIGTHTVEVTGIKVVTLDKKYIPDLGLATVAYTGSYNNLSDTPTIYSDTVRYGSSQSLTTTNKTQARTNIGAIGYESQTLTNAQKTQARTNIGAGTSSFSGSYEDLTNKPSIVNPSVIREDYGDTAVTVSSIRSTDGRSSISTFDSIIKFPDSFSTSSQLRIHTKNNNNAGYQTIYGSSYNLINEYYYSANDTTYYGKGWASSDNNRIYFLSDDGIFILREEEIDYTEEVVKLVLLNDTFIKEYIDPKYLPEFEETVIDATLTQSGCAADAQITGDSITQLDEQKADKTELEVVNTSITQINSSITQLDEQKADKTELEQKADKSDLEKLNTPKNYFILIDQASGITYHVAMRDGNLISYAPIEGISVTQMPDKVTYTAGEYFDPTGMIVSSVMTNGTVNEITEYTIDEQYVSNYLTDDVIEVGISYTDGDGIAYITSVPITVNPFDPETMLVDFEYTANEDGTYTLTGWKQTLNGEASTEMIIPDNPLIVL